MDSTEKNVESTLHLMTTCLLSTVGLELKNQAQEFLEHLEALLYPTVLKICVWHHASQIPAVLDEKHVNNSRVRWQTRGYLSDTKNHIFQLNARKSMVYWQCE